jgi:TetR/AcrR family transcriptional regulator of autoinduction and epiphytic fitness
MARARGPTLSERKREAILQAAADTFRQVGFHATTMDAIAERAGVSKRTVYNHFPSKDMLFDRVTDGLWARLVPLVEPPSEAGASVETRLSRLARRRLDSLLDPDLIKMLRVVLSESVSAPELARAFAGYRGRKDLLGLYELLEEEVQRGRLQIEQLELAASLFWGTLLGAVFWPLVLGLRGPPDEIEREIVVRESVAMFLGRYGVRRRAR